MILSKENIELLRASLKNQSELLEKIMAPVKDQCNSEKEQIELCQTAKMISLLDANILIIRKSESPDFIIERYGIRIGLEHQTIKNLNRTQSEGSKKQLVEKALEIFNFKPSDYRHYAELYPQCPFMLVSVELSQKLQFRKTEQDSLAEQIADYIWSKAIKVHCEKPNFINHIHISPHIKNSFYYKSDINKTENLNFERIKEAISKKEELLPKYKVNSDTAIQWLLLTAGTLSSDSFEIEELRVKKIDSSFDKIYLLDDFRNVLHALK